MKRLVLAVAACAAAGAVMLVSAGALRWWRAPAVVADHVTASAATLEMRIGGASELAQWVVPDREGLSVIELVLAAQSPDLPGDVVVRIGALQGDAPARGAGGDWPATLPPPERRVVLREVRLRAAGLPRGSAFGTGQGALAERWTPVRFEPVVPSAGRALLVEVSYPEGGGPPGAWVSTLARFPGTYARGELFVNAFRGNGTLLVRLANDETNAAAVRRTAANVARRLPFGPASTAVVASLAGAAAAGVVVLVAGLAWANGGAPRAPSSSTVPRRACLPGSLAGWGRKLGGRRDREADAEYARLRGSAAAAGPTDRVAGG